MNIFIDDERNPIDVFWMNEINYKDYDWTVVKNYEEFIFTIKNFDWPEIISFDNDLQEEKEGYDCLKFLVNYVMDTKLPFPKLYFHTQNTVAKENMVNYAKNFEKANEEK